MRRTRETWRANRARSSRRIWAPRTAVPTPCPRALVQIRAPPVAIPAAPAASLPARDRDGRDDAGHGEPAVPARPGVPVVERDEEARDEDERRDEPEVAGEPRRVQGRDDHRLEDDEEREGEEGDPGHDRGAEREQVDRVPLLVGEHDRELVPEARDHAEHLRDRGEDREQAERLGQEEPGQQGRGEDDQDLGEGRARHELQHVAREAGAGGGGSALLAALRDGRRLSAHVCVPPSRCPVRPGPRCPAR